MSSVDTDFLKDNGASSWGEYFKANGFDFTEHNDTLKLFLQSKGFAGDADHAINSFYDEQPKERKFSKDFGQGFFKWFLSWGMLVAQPTGKARTLTYEQT